MFVRPSLVRGIHTHSQLDERMMVDRAARNDKLELARRRNEKMQEEENRAVCYVCDNGDFNEHDQIIFCERCCVAVHASCYNVVGVRVVVSSLLDSLVADGVGYRSDCVLCYTLLTCEEGTGVDDQRNRRSADSRTFFILLP